MSSKHNDTTIHLGNYEEFFLLYLDNELSEDQMAMVDDFLNVHPYLRSEFDLLAGTRFHPEPVFLDKQALMADRMQAASLDEDLLLYIDNELPSAKKRIIELELVANPAFQQQYQLLMQTKLSGEPLSYPDKKELYRHERTVRMPWMRVAAAVLIVAGAGALYLVQRTSPGNIQNPPVQIAHTGPAPKVKGQVTRPDETQAPALVARQDAPKQNQAPKSLTKPVLRNNVPGNDLVFTPVDRLDRKRNSIGNPDVQQNDNSAEMMPDAPRTTAIAASASVKTINKLPVTSLLPSRTTIVTAASPESPSGEGYVAGNKGSIKGFLRKATRLIEKKTGINPINDDGELLIGAVAVKLE